MASDLQTLRDELAATRRALVELERRVVAAGLHGIDSAKSRRSTAKRLRRLAILISAIPDCSDLSAGIRDAADGFEAKDVEVDTRDAMACLEMVAWRLGVPNR